MLCFTSVLIVAYIFLALIVFKNVSCFVMTAKKIYDMSGVRIDFGNKRFVHEQMRFVYLYLNGLGINDSKILPRFLTYLTLFTITLVTWAVEICTWDLVTSHKSFVAADALKCLHALTIFGILVFKRSVRETIIRNVCCCWKILRQLFAWLRLWLVRFVGKVVLSI